MKPSDFFLGVIDFFAVLVPGAILTGIVWPLLSAHLVDRLDPLGSTALTVAFVLVSYVLGQLAFAASSRLDPWYDRWRGRSSGDDPSLSRARSLAEAEGWPPAKHVSIYKWAEARLRIESPSAIAAVDRAQAESKFFRTLTVVLVTTTVFGFLAGRGTEVVISLALLPIATARFFQTRLSATRLAYHLYVANNVVLTGRR